MAKDFTIDPTGIRQSTQLSTHGTGFTDVWQVPYVITSGPAQGVSGTVNIPASMYDAETVAATVQSAVDSHQAVAAI